jgi:DNA-binding transcriptional regulator YhcF (GntR family)
MGIDPANCLDILPGWEGAGDTTKNIITGESKVLGSRTTFNKNNLRTELISASETNPGILDVRTSEFATKNLTLRFDLNVLYVNSNFYNIGGISTAGYGDYRFQIRTVNTETTVFSHRITGSSLKNIHICSNSALRAANSITATYDGSWLRAYLDRDLIYSENSPGEVDVSGTCYLSIGQQANRASRTLSMDLYCFSYFSQTLSPAQIAQLHETPYALLMPVSRPFIFDMAGGIEKIENITSVINSEASVLDRQNYIDNLQSNLLSQSTLSDLKLFLESLVTQGYSETSVIDLAGYIESIVSHTESISTVSEIQNFIENLLTQGLSTTEVEEILENIETLLSTVNSFTFVSDKQNYKDNISDILNSDSTIRDFQTYRNILLSEIEGFSEISDFQSYVELLQSKVDITTFVSELQEFVERLVSQGYSYSQVIELLDDSENLISALISISNVADSQNYLDFLETRATIITSISDIQNYIDTLLTRGVSISNVQDLLNVVEIITSEFSSSSFVSDFKLLVENLISVGVSLSEVTDEFFIAYIESLQSILSGETNVFDIKEVIENILSVLSSDINISDFQQFSENLESHLVNISNIKEVQNYVDSLLTQGLSVSEVNSFITDLTIRSINAIFSLSTPSMKFEMKESGSMKFKFIYK